MSQQQTPGQRVVETLWPHTPTFKTAWGLKHRDGLAAAIDNLTAAPDLLEACHRMFLCCATDACRRVLGSDYDEVFGLAWNAMQKAKGNR